MACDAGQYAAPGSGVCHTCAAGYRCANTSAPNPVPCATGFWSPAKATNCSVCPAVRVLLDVFWIVLCCRAVCWVVS